MNITKSYEALAADLASEKIISKTLQRQKEEFMMLADSRKVELDALQQRLTVAEQRADDLESLVRDVEPMVAKKHSSPWFAKRYAALKPAAGDHRD